VEIFDQTSQIIDLALQVADPFLIFSIPPINFAQLAGWLEYLVLVELAGGWDGSVADGDAGHAEDLLHLVGDVVEWCVYLFLW